MYVQVQSGQLLSCATCQSLRSDFRLVDAEIAERMCSSGYSCGESAMLFQHRRDIASAISLSTPGMNSSVKLNSPNAMYHRTIIGYEAPLINNKFR